MLVRQIILDALSRLGIAKKGTAPADQMDKALDIFTAALRKYSGDDVITAFQRVATFDVDKDETTVGMFRTSRGKRVLVADSLPNASGYVPGRDFAYVGGNWYQVQQVTTQEKAWVSASSSSCTDFCPDVIVTDMERIVSVRVKDTDGWHNLEKTNLAQYDPEDRLSYVANPCGDRCERLYTSARGQCRVVYNASMSGMDMNSSVNVPEQHVELLTLAVCVGCARTAEQLSRYAAELSVVEDGITASNTNERIPEREVW